MGETSKKIVNLDINDLLKTLNIAFAEEWLAYYQYWIGSKIAVGIMRPNIVKEFEEHAEEEKTHAEMLATRIIQLGGTPILNPNEWEKLAHCKYLTPKDFDVVALLKQNLESERCAIARYQNICEISHAKDFETYNISAQILKEEIEHEQELEDFLADIKNVNSHQ